MPVIITCTLQGMFCDTWIPRTCYGGKICSVYLFIFQDRLYHSNFNPECKRDRGFINQLCIELGLWTSLWEGVYCLQISKYKQKKSDRWVSYFFVCIWCRKTHIQCMLIHVQGVLCIRGFLRLWKNNHVSRKPCKRRSDLVLNGHMRVPK